MNHHLNLKQYAKENDLISFTEIQVKRNLTSLLGTNGTIIVKILEKIAVIYGDKLGIYLINSIKYTWSCSIVCSDPFIIDKHTSVVALSEVILQME